MNLKNPPLGVRTFTIFDQIQGYDATFRAQLAQQAGKRPSFVANTFKIRWIFHGYVTLPAHGFLLNNRHTFPEIVQQILHENVTCSTNKRLKEFDKNSR